MILKVLTSLILALLPLAILVRDWKFHDKRTKVHHQITSGILIVWLITSIVAVAFVWQETYRSSILDKKVEGLVTGRSELLVTLEAAQTRLRELENFLEPIVSRTIQNYPGLTEREAHHKLAPFYSPRERLSELLTRILNRDTISDSDVIRILVLSKQLIEFREEKDLYPVLYFWCEWCLSLSSSQSYTCALMLTEMTRVLMRDEKDFPLQMCELIGMNRLRTQFIGLFKSEGLPTYMFTSFRRWKWLGEMMVKEALNKPIEIPEGFETIDNPIGRLYRDVWTETKRKSGDGAWAHWFVRKLWLATDWPAPEEGADSEGTVRLIVETDPKLHFTTDLRIRYNDKEFDSQ